MRWFHQCRFSRIPWSKKFKVFFCFHHIIIIICNFAFFCKKDEYWSMLMRTWPFPLIKQMSSNEIKRMTVRQRIRVLKFWRIEKNSIFSRKNPACWTFCPACHLLVYSSAMDDSKKRTSQDISPHHDDLIASFFDHSNDSRKISKFNDTSSPLDSSSNKVLFFSIVEDHIKLCLMLPRMMIIPCFLGEKGWYLPVVFVNFYFNSKAYILITNVSK